MTSMLGAARRMRVAAIGASISRRVRGSSAGRIGAISGGEDNASATPAIAARFAEPSGMISSASQSAQSGVYAPI
jgi:uncharacterized membrane protein